MIATTVGGWGKKVQQTSSFVLRSVTCFPVGKMEDLSLEEGRLQGFAAVCVELRGLSAEVRCVSSF